MTEKKFVRFQTEVVNGVCPTCNEHTILVGITREFYRCINCGADMEQHINGAINYIPTISPNTLKSKLDKYFGDGEKI
jgi:uncharacterized protein (DUF983 family)